MLIRFKDLPSNSRVWIFQSSRAFTLSEIVDLKNKIETFLENWKSHGHSFESAYELPYNRFVVIGLNESSTDASVESTVSGGYKGWGFHANFSVTGKVATHKENTRKTDNSAKYDVSVKATQLPATEGMLKLSDYLQEMMEPSLIPLSKNTN